MPHGPIAGQMTFKLADEVFAGSDKSFADSVPLRRRGTPDEVAVFVCFLLSDDSRYATGTTHSVDGGFTTARYRNVFFQDGTSTQNKPTNMSTKSYTKMQF